MITLKQCAAMAQNYANNEGVTYAVFNLNTVGTAMYVARKADSFPGKNLMVAGHFEPQPVRDE